MCVCVWVYGCVCVCVCVCEYVYMVWEVVRNMLLATATVSLQT